MSGIPRWANSMTKLEEVSAQGDKFDESILRASTFIKQGGIVVFPTETVFGLGCDGTNPDAIKRVFELKRRPLTNPVILHVTDSRQAMEYLDLDSIEEPFFMNFTDKVWPGPITIVAKAKASVPPIVTANSGYVALRAPKHRVARALIEASGVPIAGPSANISCRITATEPGHVYKYFGHENIMLLSDGWGCQFGMESTVLKIEKDENQNLYLLRLRPGFQKLDDIAKEAGCPVVDYKEIAPDPEGGKPRVSPGMLSLHYAPTIPLFTVLPSEGWPFPLGFKMKGPKNVSKLPPPQVCYLMDPFYMCWMHAREFTKYITVPPPHNQYKVNQQVYPMLHTAEQDALRLGLQCIVIPPIPPEQEYDGLRDRITRASGGRYGIFMRAGEKLPLA